MGWLNRIFWTLSAFGGLYAVFLGLLLDPRLQRFCLYGNKVNTLFMDNLYEPQNFGFMKGQVKPFNITTPDDETLFAWHILPMSLYAKHETELKAEHEAAVPYTASLAYRLAHEDLETKVVVSFHGNAGHLANGARKTLYRVLTISSDAHVIAFDYRGFGHSTGVPNEEGVTTDGIAVVNFVLNELLVPSERVVLMGQSLGTGIVTATALHFADPKASLELLPTSSPYEIVHKTARPAGNFAAVILIAPFTSIRELVKTYYLVGVIPVVSPLRIFPSLQKFFIESIMETWITEKRIAALVSASARSTSSSRHLRLHMLHATNDYEIRYWHSEDLFYTAVNASQPGTGLSKTTFASWQQNEIAEGRGGRLSWIWGEVGPGQSRKSGSGEVLLEILQTGGHNTICGFVNVPLAVQRAFESLDADV